MVVFVRFLDQFIKQEWSKDGKARTWIRFEYIITAKQKKKKCTCMLIPMDFDPMAPC